MIVVTCWKSGQIVSKDFCRLTENEHLLDPFVLDWRQMKNYSRSGCIGLVQECKNQTEKGIA